MKLTVILAAQWDLNSDLRLLRIGITDRIYAHVADMDRPIAFRAVMRLFGNRFYIYIPRWATTLYQRGEEVEISITPLGRKAQK